MKKIFSFRKYYHNPVEGTQIQGGGFPKNWL